MVAIASFVTANSNAESTLSALNTGFQKAFLSSDVIALIVDFSH